LEKDIKSKPDVFLRYSNPLANPLKGILPSRRGWAKNLLFSFMITGSSFSPEKSPFLFR